MTLVDEKNLRRELFMDLYHLIKKIDKQFDQIERQLLEKRPKKKLNITPPQLFVLRLLWYEDGFPLKYLATAARCSRSSITSLIDTMESNGLVFREQNPKDGRSILVRLTEVGRELRHYTPPLDTYMTNKCENISKEELQTLNLILRKFSKSLEY